MNPRSVIAVDILITNLDNIRIGNFYFDILILGICICRASRSYNQNDTEMVLLTYSYNHIYYDITHCIFIKIFQPLSQRRYIRLELCLRTFVYLRGLVVRVVDLRLRVRDLL